MPARHPSEFRTTLGCLIGLVALLGGPTACEDDPASVEPREQLAPEEEWEGETGEDLDLTWNAADIPSEFDETRRE